MFSVRSTSSHLRSGVHWNLYQFLNDFAIVVEPRRGPRRGPAVCQSVGPTRSLPSRLSCLCQTDAVIQKLMSCITKCAQILEDVVIATREYFGFCINDSDEAEAFLITESRGGHWLTPITITECKMLRKVEMKRWAIAGRGISEP